MHEGGRRLFSEDDYSSGIVALSKEIVADNAACRVRVRTLSGVVYECRWCQSCEYSLVRDENSGYWIGWKKGEHSEAQHRPKALREHVGLAIAHGMSHRLKGEELRSFVSEFVHVPIPKSTLKKYVGQREDVNWRELWRKIPSMGFRLTEAGLRYQDFMKVENGKTILEGFVFELPAMRFAKSSGFLGIVFVDGAHMGDRMKSTMISLITVTSDHVILPLAVLIGPTEDKLSYTRLFEFARPSLPNSFTIMSDQSQAMEGAYNDLFASNHRIAHVPCFFHILKGKNKQVAWEVRQILTADHPAKYDAFIRMFAKTRPSLYQTLAVPLGKVSFLSSNCQSKFEFIADSPVESFNAALKEARYAEPLYLVKAIFAFHDKQYQRQLESLPMVEVYCKSCSNTVNHRREQGRKLMVIKEPKGFVVTEAISSGITINYELHMDGSILKCTCQGYERLGIPCRHMFAVEAKFDTALPTIWDVHKCQVIRHSMGNTVSVNLSGLTEQNVECRAPRKKQGRPRKQRLRPFAEHLASQPTCVCSACGQRGHTKRPKKCPLRPTPPEPRRRARSVSSVSVPIRPSPVDRQTTQEIHRRETMNLVMNQ